MICFFISAVKYDFSVFLILAKSNSPPSFSILDNHYHMITQCLYYRRLIDLNLAAQLLMCDFFPLLFSLCQGVTINFTCGTCLVASETSEWVPKTGPGGVLVFGLG